MIARALTDYLVPRDDRTRSFTRVVRTLYDVVSRHEGSESDGWKFSACMYRPDARVLRVDGASSTDGYSSDGWRQGSHAPYPIVDERRAKKGDRGSDLTIRDSTMNDGKKVKFLTY